MNVSTVSKESSIFRTPYARHRSRYLTKRGSVASRPESIGMRARIGAVRASEIAARLSATALSPWSGPASARPKSTSTDCTGASPSRWPSSTVRMASALRRMTACCRPDFLLSHRHRTRQRRHRYRRNHVNRRVVLPIRGALKDAGFNEAQAEAVVSTVGDTVHGYTAVLADSIATIAENMATRDTVSALAVRFESMSERMESRSDRTATKDYVADVADRMATKENVTAGLAELPVGMLAEFKTLYRHLLVMGTSIVSLSVVLITLLP